MNKNKEWLGYDPRKLAGKCSICRKEKICQIFFGEWTCKDCQHLSVMTENVKEIWLKDYCPRCTYSFVCDKNQSDCFRRGGFSEAIKTKKDEYLQSYKPKDTRCHYDKCEKCGGHDLSFVLAEFGICLECWKKFKRKIPRALYVPLGRMLLYYSKSKQTNLAKEWSKL